MGGKSSKQKKSETLHKGQKNEPEQSKEQKKAEQKLQYPEKLFFNGLNSLCILPDVLNRLVVEYETREWESIAQASWKLEMFPYGINTYQQQIYISQGSSHLVTVKELNGETILKNNTLQDPTGIDIDTNQSLIYIASKFYITVFDSKLLRSSSWGLPALPTRPVDSQFRGIKVNGQYLYLTVAYLNQIFLCNKQDGQLMDKWGTEKPGAFNHPMGLTIVNQNVYICNHCEHNIQILNKEKGIFITQWGRNGKLIGQFYYPTLSEIRFQS